MNTIFHDLADEWDRRTNHKSYKEITIYNQCAWELRRLTDKWQADIDAANEAAEIRKRNFKSECIMADANMRLNKLNEA